MIVMYEKFAQLLAVHGITANTVAKAAHVNASTFTDWKQGKSQPKLEKLQKDGFLFCHEKLDVGKAYWRGGSPQYGEISINFFTKDK